MGCRLVGHVASLAKKFNGKTFIEWVGHLTVRDLFVTKKNTNDLVHYLIDEAHLYGLLWCFSRRPISPASWLFSYHGIDLFNQFKEKGQFDIEMFEPDPNGMKCNPSTNKCEQGSSTDYRQEVDGVCNTMSG